jgi:hypothetical protein
MSGLSEHVRLHLWTLTDISVRRLVSVAYDCSRECKESTVGFHCPGDGRKVGSGRMGRR